MFDEVKITDNKKTTMLGNFSYYNPTKLYFGDESLNFLKDELKGYGPVVLLNYGSGSVKRNGIYDQVVAILKEAGKTIVENPGVMTNPTLEKLHEGVKIARENEVDLILALGGGSVCDYSKAVAASVYYEGDYWDKFWLKQENPAKDQRLLPVGCILTMAGTGSEMNAGTVITDAEHTFKVGHLSDFYFLAELKTSLVSVMNSFCLADKRAVFQAAICASTIRRDSSSPDNCAR